MVFSQIRGFDPSSHSLDIEGLNQRKPLTPRRQAHRPDGLEMSPHIAPKLLRCPVSVISVYSRRFHSCPFLTY
jgi:hypothetical protein